MFSRAFRKGIVYNCRILRQFPKNPLPFAILANSFPFPQVQSFHSSSFLYENESTLLSSQFPKTDHITPSFKEITSFEHTLSLIPGYQERTLEENMQLLIECGHFSPGVLQIQHNNSMKQIQELIQCISDSSNLENLSKINHFYIIRTLWALPRLGYTYKSDLKQSSILLQWNCHLVDNLISFLLNQSSTLTPVEWAVIMKSLGKLRYSCPSQTYDQLLNGVFSCYQSLYLSQLCDVVWGLVRLKGNEKNGLSQQSLQSNLLPNLLNNDHFYLICQQLEDKIKKDQIGLKKLSHSRLANLVYSLSYLHYPNRSKIFNQLIPCILYSISQFSVSEVTTLFTGYTESSINNPKLLNSLIKAFLSNTTISSTNALSFLYSYSRCICKDQLTEVNIEVLERMNQLITQPMNQMTSTELVYLLSAYNNLDYFPASLSSVYSRLNKDLMKLTDDQCFIIMHSLLKSQIRNENSKQIYYSLYQHYIRDYDKNLKSPSYSNILCVLVRYAVSHNMYLNPYLSTLKKDLQVNQVNYNSHAISSLLHCIAHMRKPDISLYTSLLQLFTTQCMVENNVSEYDIIYGISSLRDLMNEPAVKEIIPSFISSINQWCNHHIQSISPHLLSFLLLKYHSLHQPTDAFVYLFESQYFQHLDQFSIQDIIVLLKAFTFIHYNKENVMNVLYKRVEDQINNLSSTDLLSVLWTIAQGYTNQVKVYAEIKDELSKRDLTSKQRKNYQDIVNLFIYHS